MFLSTYNIINDVLYASIIKSRPLTTNTNTHNTHTRVFYINKCCYCLTKSEPVIEFFRPNKPDQCWFSIPKRVCNSKPHHQKVTFHNKIHSNTLRVYPVPFFSSRHFFVAVKFLVNIILCAVDYNRDCEQKRFVVLTSHIFILFGWHTYVWKVINQYYFVKRALVIYFDFNELKRRLKFCVLCVGTNAKIILCIRYL